MNQEIRFALYELEIFFPMSNSGQSIEGMILNFEDLEKFSFEDIEHEILLMQSEGLITQRDFSNDPKKDAWWPTKKGQIEVQKLKIKNNYRSLALANQDKYSSEDLVLGIIAAYKVSQEYHFRIHNRKIIEYYLFDKDEAELRSGFDILISNNYISTEWEDTGFGGPTLTSTGLLYYKNTVHQRLGLDIGQSILDPKQSLQLDERFEKLGFDQRLVVNLQKRWKEAQQTKEANALLASLTMLGSILEGLLYASFAQDMKSCMTAKSAPRDKNKKATRPLEDWKLQEMINVAVEIGLVSKAVSKHSHELRDSRNLIHPYKQFSENFEVDEALVKISFEVVNTVLDSLLKYFSTKIIEKQHF